MVTHFQLFFRKPRAPKKSSKWEPKWSRRAPKSQKISNSEHSKSVKNITLQKVGAWSHFDLKNDLLFRAGSVLKITKIRDIFKIGPQVSKMSPWPPKMTQNHKSDHPKSRKFWGSKKWHGGGLCAQRTGYFPQ